MQVILTEEEYLALKRDKEALEKGVVSKVQVYLAFESVMEEVMNLRNVVDPTTMVGIGLDPNKIDWESICYKFKQRLDLDI